MKWKLSLGILAAIILITAFWLYNNRSEAVYERIMNQKGYTLSLVKEGISVDFFVKPEWIPEQNGEETKLNLVLAEKFDSKIVLEKVAKREKDFYIQLNLIPKPDKTSGQLLSISQIANGSFSSGDPKWQVTDQSGKDLLGGSYGYGSGPLNVAVLFIDDEKREQFNQGVHVRYSGYYLYGYRQEPGQNAPLWLIILPYAVLAVVFFALYRKRSEPEKGLGWKLIGYMLLGGFTFTLNSVRLPLGFAIYGLFFRKPRLNQAVKHKAALVGLLMFLYQLAAPGLAGYLISEPRSTIMHEISMGELGIEGIWKMAAARAAVSNQARVQSFETVLSKEGEWKELAFELVDRNEKGRYIHIHAVYNPADRSMSLERSSTDEWLQFPRQLMAQEFFERVRSLELMNLKPAGGESAYVQLELLENGTLASYAMKDARNFGIDERGVYPIGVDQLPVKAYGLLACGVALSEGAARGCENPAHYYFGIVEGGARQ